MTRVAKSPTAGDPASKEIDPQMTAQPGAPTGSASPVDGTSRRSAGVVLVAVLALCALVAVPTANAAGGFPGEGFLPDGRVWELVSPPDKNGGYAVPASNRTRVAADGGAVGFYSLAGFADVEGMGVGVDYMAQRSGGGWVTHSLMPPGPAIAFTPLTTASVLQPMYVGEFSEDLDTAVFRSWAALSPDPSIDQARAHLYVRDDLRTPGEGSYELVSACPRCAGLPAPLAAPATPLAAEQAQPVVVSSSPDLSHVAFLTRRALTDDSIGAGPRLYESTGGQVRLVGRIPTGTDVECDDAGAPACVPVDVSSVGQGNSGSGVNNPAGRRTEHRVSDGSDGHSRIFFTWPTNTAGTATQASAFDGKLYMRVDGSQTVQLNASERTDCAGDPTCGGDDIPDPAPAAFARALFLDASVDGTRSFFSTNQALTDNAPTTGSKLYVYDATKPASAPDNLALVNVDNEPDDNGGLTGLIGTSDDGQRAYFIQTDQLVDGEPTDAARKIFLWDNGNLSFVAPFPIAAAPGEVNENLINISTRHGARVSPDGRHMLFVAFSGEGLTGYDHGTACVANGVSNGVCREFYVYDADSDEVQCVSCNPSGAPATVDASGWVLEKPGGALDATERDPRTLSDDGRYVFFSTGERLVAEDTNGPCPAETLVTLVSCTDAYVYDTVEGRASLLSSGKSGDPSVFLDASADGRSAFIATTEQLSGWDVDGNYDIYVARVDGGLPEPEPAQAGCVDNDACKGAASGAPTGGALGSLGVGEGNPVQSKPRSCASARRRLTRANRTLKRAATKTRRRNARKAVRKARRQLATCKRSGS